MSLAYVVPEQPWLCRETLAGKQNGTSHGQHMPGHVPEASVAPQELEYPGGHLGRMNGELQ